MQKIQYLHSNFVLYQRVAAMDLPTGWQPGWWVVMVLQMDSGHQLPYCTTQDTNPAAPPASSAQNGCSHHTAVYTSGTLLTFIAGFDVVTELLQTIQVFWNVMLYRWVNGS